MTKEGWLLLGAGLVLLASVAWGETLPVTRVTTREGLAGNRVKAIVSDPTGFLWFGTDSGLGRYDGHEFVAYGPADGLPHVSVNDLLVTVDGSYWVATNGGGVTAFRPRSTEGPLFVPVPISDPAPGSRRVNTLHEAAHGRIWAGTDAGLFSWHPGQGEETLRLHPLALEAPDGPAGRRPPVWSLAEDLTGRLWIGTSRGLYALSPEGAPVHHRVGSASTSDVVHAVLFDAGRRLWVGHEDGVLVLVPGPEGEPLRRAASLAAEADPCSPLDSPAGHLSLPEAPGDSCFWVPPGPENLSTVWALFEDREERVWVATDSGLASVADGRVESYRGTLSLPDRSLLALGQDTGGNLWLGTTSHGAALVVLDGFVTYGEADGLVDPVAFSLLEGPRGRLHVVTRGRLVHRVEEGGLVSVEVNFPEPTARGGPTETHYAAWDTHGDWWFPTSQGLYRFPAIDKIEELATREALGPYTRRDGLAGDDTRIAFPDSDGDLWVATRFPGREVLTRWERSTGVFHRYSDSHGLPPHNYALSFLEHPSGTLWFGFWEGGLARYRGGEFELFGSAEGVPGGAVVAFLADPDGGLWVGSHEGLARSDDPEAARPRFAKIAGYGELPQISTLVSDLHGRLYIGTRRGLFQLDPETGRFDRFTVAEGLASDTVRTAFLDRGGDLWFGTAAGLSRLSPRSPVPRDPPAARIQGLAVDGLRWALPELGTTTAGLFTLPRRPARIRIDFGALSFHPGEVLRYRYRLEGAAPDWEPVGEERSVLLGNLGPGRYRFAVEAIDSLGQVSPEAATLSFTVPTPVWRRGWFLALVAVVLASLLAGAHRLRVRRLLELERVRNRIAADLHDELGASLTRISILSEVARRRAGDGAEPILEVMGETARSLLESTRDLVWAIDPRRDDLAGLVVRLRTFATDLLEGRGMEWELSTEGPLAATTLGPEQRRHLLLLYKEALHNAVRHSAASRVRLSLEVGNGRLSASVEDDGRGIDPAQLEAEPGDGAGLGLANLRQRAAALGGRLEIESGPGDGTRVRLVMPLR